MTDFILFIMFSILLFAYLSETCKCRTLEDTIDKLERKLSMIIGDDNG